MSTTKTMTLIEVLRDQGQADEDGVMVTVSRQAVDEAIALLEAQAWTPVSEKLPETGGCWFDVCYEASNGPMLGQALLRGDLTGWMFVPDQGRVYAWRKPSELPLPAKFTKYDAIKDHCLVFWDRTSEQRPDPRNKRYWAIAPYESGNLWLFYWHDAQESWVTLKKVNQEFMENSRHDPRAEIITPNRESGFWDQLLKFTPGHIAKRLAATGS